MAQDLEQLVLSISADTRQIQRAMKKLEGSTSASTRRIERRFDGLGQRINRTFSGIGRGMVAALAAGVSVRAMKNLSDAATRIDNALKVAGLSGSELEKVYGRLRDSAVRNAAPIESLVELYGRAALVQKELGITGEELLGFTDKIALALRVSGQSAAELSGALLQLAQALGSGVVRAEEFSSILEGALPIAQATARGLKEAGGSVSRLRQLVIDGKVSSEAFFRAFEAGAPMLEEKVADAEFTISQAMGNLQTALIDSVREFNASTGAAENFAGGVNNIAEAISDFDISGFIDKIAEARGALERFLNDAGDADIFRRLGIAIGTADAEGNILNFETEEAKRRAEAMEREIALLQATIAKNTELGFDSTDALARLGEVSATLARLRGEISGMPVLQSDSSGGGRGYEPGTPGDPNALARATLGPAKVATVSLDDFALPSDKDKKSTKERADEYERLSQRIAESTSALHAETAAMASINPLVDDYGFAVERARVEHDLLAAAQEAGKELTPALRAEIAVLADQYALAGAAATQLAESQDNLRERMEDFRDLGTDVVGGFVSDLQQGTEALDAVANALRKVGQELINSGIESLFGQSGSSNWLTSLFGAFTNGGGSSDPWGGMRAGGGPVSKGKAYIVGEKRPELFVPDQSGTIIPRVPQMPSVASSGGGQSIVVSFNPVIDNRGASVEAVARNEQQIAKMKAELPAMVIASVRKAQSTRQI